MKYKGLIKKCIVIMLTVMMFALTFTGCGSSDRDADDNESKVKDEQLRYDEADKDKDKEETTQEPSPELTPESTPEPTPEPTPATVTWENAYEDFFYDYGPVIKENVLVNAFGNFEDLSLRLAYGFCMDSICEGISINDTSIELIGTLDTMYCYSKMDGEHNYIYATQDIDYIQEIENIFMVDDFLNYAECITYENYVEEIAENDIFYDVVSGQAKDVSTGKWYNVECCINRETQEILYIDILLENNNFFRLYFKYFDKDGFKEYINGIADSVKDTGDEVSLEKMEKIYTDFYEMDSFKELFDANMPVADDAEIDWNVHYANYFNKPIAVAESFQIQYNAWQDEYNYSYIVGRVPDKTRVYYWFDEYSLYAFIEDDSIVIGSPDVDSVEWVSAKLESEEQYVDVIGKDFIGDMEKKLDELTYVEYLGSERINGVVYDIIDVSFADEDMGSLVYINRETQKLYKIGIVYENYQVVYFFEGDPYIDVLPPKARNAEELSVDEITVYYEVAKGMCEGAAKGN